MKYKTLLSIPVALLMTVGACKTTQKNDISDLVKTTPKQSIDSKTDISILGYPLGENKKYRLNQDLQKRKEIDQYNQFQNSMPPTQRNYGEFFKGTMRY